MHSGSERTPTLLISLSNLLVIASGVILSPERAITHVAPGQAHFFTLLTLRVYGNVRRSSTIHCRQGFFIIAACTLNRAATCGSPYRIMSLNSSQRPQLSLSPSFPGLTALSLRRTFLFVA